LNCSHNLPAGKDFPFAQERFLLLSGSVAATFQVSNLRSVEMRYSPRSLGFGGFSLLTSSFVALASGVIRWVYSCKLLVGSLDDVLELTVEPLSESCVLPCPFDGQRDCSAS